MKKKLLAMLLVVVAFSMKNVYAADPQVLVRERVDFRVYVEDEKGRDVTGLQFSIHDKNNAFSYTSSYNEDAKYYYFSANTFEGNNDTSYTTNVPAVFTDEELNCLSTKNFNNGLFNSEVFSINEGSYGNLNAYYKYVPMVLEETSTVEKKTVKIEKIIYGVIHVIPNPSGPYDLVFQLINNNIEGNNSELSYVAPTNSSMRLKLIGNTFEEQVLSTRKKILKFDEETLETPVVGNEITSSEGKVEVYLNRSTAVTEETNSSSSAPSYTEGKKRTAEINVSDNSIDAIANSLPVIIQERVVESPITLYNGILLLVVLVVIGGGIAYYTTIQKKRKKVANTNSNDQII